MLEISFYLVLLIMSNGHEAKILTPYIHALKDVVLRIYLIVRKVLLFLIVRRIYGKLWCVKN